MEHRRIRPRWPRWPIKSVKGTFEIIKLFELIAARTCNPFGLTFLGTGGRRQRPVSGIPHDTADLQVCPRGTDLPSLVLPGDAFHLLSLHVQAAGGKRVVEQKIFNRGEGRRREITNIRHGFD